MIPGLRTVLVFQRYNELAVLDELLGSVPPREKQALTDVWRESLRRDRAALEDALADLLTSGFKAQPIPLIVDKLERILERPALGDGRTGAQAEYRAVLLVVLSAFDCGAGR